MDDDEEEEQEDVINDVGSPSPPFEGIIHEEPEKQNESQGGEFESPTEEQMNDNLEPQQKEVNMNP